MGSRFQNCVFFKKNRKHRTVSQIHFSSWSRHTAAFCIVVQQPSAESTKHTFLKTTSRLQLAVILAQPDAVLKTAVAVPVLQQPESEETGRHPTSVGFELQQHTQYSRYDCYQQAAVALSCGVERLSVPSCGFQATISRVPSLCMPLTLG